MLPFQQIVVRQFNRAFFDFVRPTFTKIELLHMSDGDEDALFAWLARLEQKGWIRFVQAPSSAGYTDAVVEVLAEIRTDELDVDS